MTNAPQKILFLSDTHLVADNQGCVFDVNTHNTLNHIIEYLQQHDREFTHLFLMGDISQDGSIASYQHVNSLIKKLNIDCKFYLPGNHDNKQNMKVLQEGGCQSEKVVIIDSWCFILLDSVLSGKIYGFIDKDEFKFLQTALAENLDKQIMILMHHHPISVATPLIDQYILQNNKEFLAEISKYTNVQAVIFGHVHQAVNLYYNNINFLSCPTTCFQSTPGTTNLQLIKNIIGFRWLSIFDEYYISGIEHIPAP